MIRLVLPNLRILLGDVHLEVDVIDPQRDRLAEQPLPLLFVASPEPPVRRPADGEDHRRGAFGQDSLEVGLALRQSIRNSTSSAPRSAAAFHSSRSEPCRPRPIVTQIIAPPHSHDGHVRASDRPLTGLSTPRFRAPLEDRPVLYDGGGAGGKGAVGTADGRGAGRMSEGLTSASGGGLLQQVDVLQGIRPKHRTRSQTRDMTRD